MTFQCTLCGRQANDFNVVCQRQECSFRYLADVLQLGEYVNDIRIDSTIKIMNTGVLYKGERDGKPVFLKISHPDTAQETSPDNYGNYLKREANFLWNLQRENKEEPALPKIQLVVNELDKARTSLNYGRVQIRGTMRYYIVYDAIKDVKFLRDLLNSRPVLPPQTAAWIALQVIELLIRLNTRLQIHHFSISPDNIMLRKDNDGRWRIFLFDLGIFSHLNDNEPKTGTVNSPEREQYLGWLSRFVHPSYTAPELFEYSLGGQGIATDVYGVCLLIYEMWLGHPCYEYENRTLHSVREMVVKGKKRAITRGDLPEELRNVIDNGLSRNPNTRKSSLSSIRQLLIDYYDVMPKETPDRPWYKPTRTQVQIAAIFMVAIIMMILGLYVTQGIDLPVN